LLLSPKMGGGKQEHTVRRKGGNYKSKTGGPQLTEKKKQKSFRMKGKIPQETA